MELVRYWLALIVVVSFPGAIATWLVIHGFISHWRKVGPAVTYAVVIVLTLGSWLVMFLVQEPLLRLEFGTHVGGVLTGALLYCVAATIEILCWKHLTLGTLVGIPEVMPATGESTLLRDGIYGRMRHPRYVSWTLGLFAVALVTNYLAVFVLAVLFVPTIFLITVLEERELLERFGRAYASYQMSVPRFIPRVRLSQGCSSR
ncbi:MAG: methyltransferase family protein [Thermoanaerobaculia bacterium]